MKRTGLFFLFIFILIISSGCKDIFRGRNEINDLEFVRAIAIDTSTSQAGQVRLTLSAERVQLGGAGKSEEKKSTKVVSEGSTVFEAIRNFDKYIDKKTFLGHLEYIIIGEEAAKDDLNKYLDFFCREHGVRLNLLVFVLKGDRAENLIEMASSESKFVFDRLGGLIKGIDGQSVSNDINLIEVMYILDVDYLSLYLPCIEMIKVSKGKEEDIPSFDIKMAGFAIFERFKLRGYLSNDMGRALNWLRNEIQSGIIVVESPTGNKVSLEIIDAKTKFKPEIKDGKLIVNVNVAMSSNIGEIQFPEDIFTGKTLRYLENQQEQSIQDEIYKVVKYAQQDIGLDFFSTGSIVYHKLPIIWEDFYKDRWKSEFPKVIFNIDVDSKINRTYDIQRSNASESGER